MSHVEVGFSPAERARLAHKGRLLYGKYCGTGGLGICAESFALYHIWRGEPLVARDLLDFLDARIETLIGNDTEGRQAMTLELADRIRRHLESEGDETPEPSQWASILKAKKRQPSEDDHE